MHHQRIVIIDIALSVNCLIDLHLGKHLTGRLHKQRKHLIFCRRDGDHLITLFQSNGILIQYKITYTDLSALFRLSLCLAAKAVISSDIRSYPGDQLQGIEGLCDYARRIE